MKIVKVVSSKDKKSYKILQQTHDNHIIETGYFNLGEHIICISSQIGCPMNCVFCATTTPVDSVNPRLHFIRNLTSQEIYQQVKNVLGNKISEMNKSKPILLSYMGMGEPFLNYSNVVKSIKHISSKYRNVKQATIATSGIFPEKIKKLAKEKFGIKVKIQLSLHAPNEQLRKKIMPKAQTSIKKMLESVKYFSVVKNETIKINYMLIKGLNDSAENALELSKILYPYRQNFVVKLIVFNNFNGYKQTTKSNFDKFQDILNEHKINNVRFKGNGLDAKVSCGQLCRHYYGQK